MQKKELLWEEEKYQKNSKITVNLELLKWGTKFYLVNSFLKPETNDRVLDIGCGYGSILAAIADRIKTGTGVDVSKTAITSAVRISRHLKYKNLTFRIGDANRLKSQKQSFDKIICFDVAEHMVKPKNLFSEIDRLLKPGGKALVYTNFYGKFCWGFIKEMVRKKGKIEKLWTRDAPVLHLNRFTRGQINSYFNGLHLKYSLVFKNHWLAPVILDLMSFFRRLKQNGNTVSSVNVEAIKFDSAVPLASKIQYLLSVGEMNLLQNIPSEGVFILIEKE